MTSCDSWSHQGPEPGGEGERFRCREEKEGAKTKRLTREMYPRHRVKFNHL